jgi:hypothetical protein
MIWNYVIAAIVGIIIYQVIVMIVYAASNENDEIAITTAILLPLGLWNYIIIPIVRKIWFAWSKKHLNGYQCYCRDENGEARVAYWDIFCATDKHAAELVQDETQPYFVKKVRDGKDFKSAPNTRIVYKGQDDFLGWDMSQFKLHQPKGKQEEVTI